MPGDARWRIACVVVLNRLYFGVGRAWTRRESTRAECTRTGHGPSRRLAIVVALLWLAVALGIANLLMLAFSGRALPI